MAHQDKVASRYARAVYDVLKTPEKIRGAAQELLMFSSTMKSSEQLTQVLTSEVFSDEQRCGVVEDIAEKLKCSDATKRILYVLSEAKRLDCTGAIASKLHTLVLEAASVVPLSVSLATEITDAEKKDIEKKFSKILGKEVEASYYINPELLGGLKVTAGGRTFDGSLSGWLQQMEEKIIGGSL